MRTTTFQRLLSIATAAVLIAGFAPLAMARIYNPGTSGTVTITTGGTGTTTQVTNGVNYYDGTKITSSATLLSFNGTNFGIATSSPSWSLSVGSGQVSVPDGTVSLPSYTFSGQANTGFYRVSANIIGIASNGTLGMQFDQNTFYSANSNGFRFQNASGVSQTAPTIMPDRASSNTGFSSGATGNINAIVGAAEVTRWYRNGFAIGTSTPVANFQVATSTANATTTLEFGKSAQTKGTCIKVYDAVGTAAYISVTGTTLNVSATSCASVTGF